jgi:hypothetical protein
LQNLADFGAGKWQKRRFAWLGVPITDDKNEKKVVFAAFFLHIRKKSSNFAARFTN